MLMDDRGCACALRLHVASTSLTRARAAAVRQAIEILAHRESPAHKWVIGLAILSCIVCLIVGIAMKWPVWAIVISFVLIGLLMQSALSKLTKEVSPAELLQIRKLMLSEGLCPVCGFELLNVVATGDGCGECPKCEAAWLVSEIATRMEGEESLQPISPRAASTIIAARKSIWRAEPRLWAKDAHGASTAILRVTPKDRMRGARTEGREQQLRIAWKQVRRLGRLRRWALALALVFVWSIISIFLAVASSMSVAPWIKTVPLACLGIYLIVMVVRGYWFTSGSRARDAMLAQWTCPACAEELGVIAGGPPDVVQCPACAATWRLPVNAESPYASVSPTDAGNSGNSASARAS